MMSLRSKLGIAAAAMAITGGLLTSAAFANEAPATAAPQAQTEGTPKANPLSEAAKSVWTQLDELRQSYMEKFQADAKALTDKAVQDGTITQEEADQLLKHGGKGFGGRGHGGRGHGGKGGFFRHAPTEPAPSDSSTETPAS